MVTIGERRLSNKVIWQKVGELAEKTEETVVNPHDIRMTEPDIFTGYIKPQYLKGLPIFEEGILYGRWEDIVMPFQHSFYECLREHLEGKDFFETGYYIDLANRIGNKRAENFMHRRIAMYYDIRDNGYRWRPFKPIHDAYILLAEGRDGTLFFVNGAHRISCCLVAGVKRVVAKTIFRSENV